MAGGGDVTLGNGAKVRLGLGRIGEEAGRFNNDLRSD